MKNLFACLLTVAVLALASVRAEDFGAALAAGEIRAAFHGTGGSSGDSVAVEAVKTAAGGPDLELTLAAGFRLRSESPAAQNMVVAGVEGQMLGSDSYSPTPVILAGDTAKTYVLEAYCTDFEKDNPAADTRFKAGAVDPALAWILSKASALSTTAKQAAVWIDSDHASFRQVNEKFPVSRSDWDAAAAIVRQCRAKN